MWDIKNNAWVTVNNDLLVTREVICQWFSLVTIPWITIFFVTHEVICQWFSLVTSSLMKIIGKPPHKWPKSRYSRLRMYYFISYTLFYILSTSFRYKISLIAHFTIVTKDGLFWLNIVTSSQLICDVTRTQGTGIVTSYSSIVLARANWRKGDLH